MKRFTQVVELVRVVVFFGALLAGSIASAAPTVEDYTREPDIAAVAISPTGDRLALRMKGPDGFYLLAGMNLNPLDKPHVIAAFRGVDVNSVGWVNENRLIFSVAERGMVIREGRSATFAANFDGSGQRKLISFEEAPGSGGTLVSSRVLSWKWGVHSTLDDGSNDVIVRQPVRDNLGDLRQILLARLDTVTGESKTLSFGAPNNPLDWILDDQGQPQLVGTQAKGRAQWFWHDTQGVWQPVAEFDPYGPEALQPLRVDGDGKVLVLANRNTGYDGLYRFDPVAKVVDSDPLISIKGFDLRPVLEIDSRSKRVLGVHFTADRAMSYWFDDGLAAIQKGIDAALPSGRSNRLYCGRCETTRFFVVFSSSDRQPGEYYLFDRERKSIELIAKARPWLSEETQGRRTFQRIGMRDGLQIPVYVTHPAGSNPTQALPAVLLVHGGPFMRGASRNWSAEAQLYAGMGYRVIEPEFRGSTGYGAALFQAGWRQWGRAMQDDLADTVAWAGNQGLIDPKRVCIVGASYGGYAAMMGPIAHPGVYRCAASFAGVSDIQLDAELADSDLPRDYLKYVMPSLVGDPSKEAASLAEVSPLKRVAEIKVPLLIAHGDLDRRVPIENSRAFVSAAKAAGVRVDYVEYADTAHGFNKSADQTDYLRRLVQFLDRELKASTQP